MDLVLVLEQKGRWPIDDSLMGVSGRDAGGGWAVEKLNSDKEEKPWYAIPGTMLAELEERENDQKSRIIGLHDGAFRICWPIHNP